MTFLKWLKWWFWENRICKHSSFSECYSAHFDIGRNKGWWCKKCGKLLYTAN